MKVAFLPSCLLAFLMASASLAVTPRPLSDPDLTVEDLAREIVDETHMTIVANSWNAKYRVGQLKFDCDPNSIGLFTDGITAPGTFLQANQVDENEPTAVYSGGLGIDTGIVLCTGRISEANGIIDDVGEGIAGPNNAFDSTGNNGELSWDLVGDQDDDFAAALPNVLELFADPMVLEFQVTTTQPGYFTITVVFACDEYDDWLDQEYNDLPAVLIRSEDVGAPQLPEFKNILLIRSEESPGLIQVKPFEIQSLDDCFPTLFLSNDTAPSPPALANSPHGFQDVNDVRADVYYDHEFGGFTIPLTRQSGDRGALKPLLVPAGTHTIKIVVQDVADDNVDAAIFVKSGGFKFTPFLLGDFDLDGTVGGSDYTVMASNFGNTGNYSDGDINFDGLVNGADFTAFAVVFGQTGGRKYFAADFNDDGAVDVSDFNIWNDNKTTPSCAARFEGDANGDGAVDNDDFDIWNATKF